MSSSQEDQYNASTTTNMQEKTSLTLYERVLKGRGMILSSPVGSGKTRIGWMFIRRFQSGQILILVPPCVISQWVIEMVPILEGLTYLHVVYHGHKKERDQLLKNFLASSSPLKILITTVETCYSDIHVLSPLPWSFVVFDEIHRFRNQRAKMYQSLLHLTTCKLGLTGTLVTSNAHSDLINLLQVVDPVSYKRFIDSRDSVHVKTRKIADLHVLSLNRDDLNIRVIPKKMKWSFIDMTTLEVDVYRKSLAKYESSYFTLLSTPKGHPTYYHVLDIYKRSLCDLQKMDSYAFISEVKDSLEKFPEKRQEILKDAPLTGKHKHFLSWIKDSNPSVAIIVFDDFKTGSLVLAEKLKSLGREDVAVYSGDLVREERDDIIRKFRVGEVKILFLVKKAGGIGINLEVARHVVFLSTSFHPVEEHQCIGRADRMTSTAKVIHVSYLDYPGGFGNIRHVIHPAKDRHAQAIQDSIGIEQLDDPMGYHMCVCTKAFEKMFECWNRLKTEGVKRGVLVGAYSSIEKKVVKGEVVRVLLPKNVCEVKIFKNGGGRIETFSIKDVVPCISDMMFDYTKDFFLGCSNKRKVEDEDEKIVNSRKKSKV
jgi:SNF2 family DNA or RNA helicase